MPRKSAAAITMLDPRGQRLEPPLGLSAAERAAFVAAVRSVKPGHFAAEDVPLLTAYAAATVQERRNGRSLMSLRRKVWRIRPKHPCGLSTGVLRAA
jgi:hypothetical protein